MRNKLYLYSFSLILFLSLSMCNNPPKTFSHRKVQKTIENNTTEINDSFNVDNDKMDDNGDLNQTDGENQNSENHTINIHDELLSLEEEYTETLKPILSLKTSDPDTYWFIVSWLKTNYATPNWEGYNNTDWRTKTKETGIDCSGFARVMQKEIFNRKISGGSQGILDNQCTRIDRASLSFGDLVFFRAPYAEDDRIVHVGVYLFDNYFVHATSTKSALLGLGLNINSLDEENWTRDFVTGGKIKEI